MSNRKLQQAQNPNTSPKTLRRLYEDCLREKAPSEDVIDAIAMNPNTAMDLLLDELAFDRPADVAKNPIWALVSLENPAFWEDLAGRERQGFERVLHADAALRAFFFGAPLHTYSAPWPEDPEIFGRAEPQHQVIVYANGWVEAKWPREYAYFRDWKGFTREHVWPEYRDWNEWNRLCKEDTVGGRAKRTKESVIADPLASAKDLEWLYKQDSLAALNHPNCPPSIWWNLAVNYPWEAMQSAAFDLMTLESPDAWMDVLREKNATLIKLLIEALPKKSQHLFAAECIQRVLPLFERVYPKDKRPREAIRARQLFAQGQLPEAEWRAAMESAWNLENMSADLNATEVAFAAGSEVPDVAAWNAARAVAWDAEQRWDAVPFTAERLWQWQRGQEYLRRATGAP